jgi:hypothetical protein
MYFGEMKALNGYFEILFPWLSKCESLVTVDHSNAYQRRVFGFLAERFASYYFTNHEKFCEAPVVFTEAE